MARLGSVCSAVAGGQAANFAPRRMSTMIRRLAALDMDGTALNREHKLSSNTVDTIRRVDQAGVPIVIATGRPAMSLHPFIVELALPKPIPAICFNGACALLMKGQTGSVADHQLLFSQALEADASAAVLALCERWQWTPSLNFPLRSISRPSSPKQDELLKRFESLEGVKQERVTEWSDLADACSGTPPLKIVIVSEDPERDARLAREELPKESVHVIAAEMHVEFLNPHAHKGSALRKLCEETMGVKLEDVVAFGDNHNDIEMLTAVGEGVAMGNAKASVQAVAHRVCALTNAEDGVAQELSDMLANGRLVGSSHVSCA